MLLRHSGLRWKWILSSNTLLLLHILLIRNLLLLIRGHVGRRWMYPATHPRLLRRDLGMINVFGRIDRRFTIDSILVTRCRLWRIQTSLSSLQLRRKAGGEVREAYLYQILAFSFGDEGLKFRCRERIDEASLGHDQQ